MQNLLEGTPEVVAIATKVKEFLLRAFDASIDFIYTQVSIIFDFLTQPIVLGTLAGLSIIYMGYRWVKNKTHSI